jgi:hypothetical protein
VHINLYVYIYMYIHIYLEKCAKPTSLTPVEKRLRLVRLVREVRSATPEEVTALSAKSSEFMFVSAVW